MLFPSETSLQQYAGDPRPHLRPGEKRRPFPEDYLRAGQGKMHNITISTLFPGSL